MHQPDGAAFDVVLLLHAGCALAGLVTMATAAAAARRLRRSLESGLPAPEDLRRYFRPGVNWAGRAVYGIPVFGFALLAMSRGTYALGDTWVLIGLGLFAGVALLAEGVVWPAERCLQSAVAGGVTPTTPTRAGAFDGPGAADDRGAAPAQSALRQARIMEKASAASLVLLAVGTVLMVAQP